MYFEINKWNQRLSAVVALSLLASLSLHSEPDASQWLSNTLNVVLVILLAAMVLLRLPLQKLALKESFDLVEDVSYEDLVKQMDRERSGR